MGGRVLTIRMLQSFAEVTAVGELLAGIWESPPEQPPIDLSMVMALAHSDGYVAGAYEADELVGASVGFVGGRDRDELHSHITGVRKDRASAGIGFELKQQQRSWALERGLTTITWTFDPLIARNAYFNLSRLGGRVSEYLINFYGPMDDGLNLGQPSDRAFVRWDLGRSAETPTNVTRDAAMIIGADGQPVLRPELITEEPIELIIPADIEAIRRRDASVALAWRLALREVMSGLLDDGWKFSGFRRGGGYLVNPPTKKEDHEDR